MTTYLCDVCRSPLEFRQVQLDGQTTADRYFCPCCQKSYQKSEICQVCLLAKPGVAFTSTTYSSAILGNYVSTHCPGCRPPSKISLEFQQGSAQAFVKYFVVYGCLALCGLSIVIAIFAGIFSSH